MSVSDLKVIFFDAGYTLIKTARLEAEVFSEVVCKISGVGISTEDVSRHMSEMYAFYERMYECDSSFWSNDTRAVAVWKKMYEYLCSLLNLPQDMYSTVANTVFNYYLKPNSWAFFDDVLPILDILKQKGYRLGIISNWDSSLVSIIRGLYAESYFDCIIASADVHLHKPMPEIFNLALEKMNVAPQCAMHVGDHITADIAGSQAVGITPVYINRKGSKENLDCYCIADFSQLLEICI